MNWDRLLRREIPPPFVPNLPANNPIINFEREFTVQPAVDSVGRDEAKLPSSPTYNGFSFTTSNKLDEMIMDTYPNY